MTKDFDKFFDDYKANARNMLMWVYPLEVRSLFEKTIDLQAEAGKVMSKTVVDSFSKFAPSSK